MYVNVCNSQKVLKRIPKFTCMHNKMQTPEIVHNPSLIFSVFLKLNTCSSKKKKKKVLKECILNSLYVNSGEGVLCL